MEKVYIVYDEDGIRCITLHVKNMKEGDEYEEDLMELMGYVAQDIEDNFMSEDIVSDLEDNGYEVESIWGNELPEGVEVVEYHL